MDIKDILLFLGAGAPCAVQAALTMRLARDHRAAVLGLGLISEPALPLADAYAIGSLAVAEVLADRDRAIDDAMAPIHAVFDAAATGHGCDARWDIAGPDELPSQSARRALFADLVVMRRPDADDHAGQAFVATLALSGGAPCLVVPDAANAERGFHRILLAWNGSRPAKRTLDDALLFLERAAAVQVLIIGDATSDDDQFSDEALMVRLRHHGIQADLRRVRRPDEPAGLTILDACRIFGTDLLVMGAYSRLRAVEAVLGGATRTVLAHSPIPVLMSH